MNVHARKEQEPEVEERTPEQEAAIKAVAAWVQQFSRTLKNCKLYDAKNATAARFKQDLGIALQRLLDVHGTITLKFTSEDVTFEEASLYPARSRDDNFGLVFYRDGVRGLTFAPGVRSHEVDALLDALIQVTGQSQSEDDLVTLLWQAQLAHIDVDYVPGQADVGGSGASSEGATVPWPTGASAAEPEEPSADAAAAEPEPGSEQEAQPGGDERSDDWQVGEKTAEIEASFEELESMSASETERFQKEYRDEHETSPVTASLGLARAFLNADISPDDRIELARFMPRVLRLAFLQGSWREAGEALEVLGRCGSNEWSVETFAQELLQPISISSMKERLEAQEPAAVADFIAFSHSLGDPTIDILNHLLAEIQSPRHQKIFIEALVEACRTNPERLAPWLAEPRWFVVRNTVQILGTIGGSTIASLFDPLTHHPEPRVRLEVINALRGLDHRVARPLLMRLLETADTRMFCAILHQLAQVRDTSVARMLLGHLIHAEFERRPSEEKRAIYSALASSGGDEVVPELEAELNEGNWFSRTQEAHRQAVARCIARIGTPLARQVLERGAQSRRAPVRKACEDVLPRFGSHE
jgi:hypothetical protein